MKTLIIIRSESDRDHDRYVLKPDGMRTDAAIKMVDEIVAKAADEGWDDIEDLLAAQGFEPLLWSHSNAVI